MNTVPVDGLDPVLDIAPGTGADENGTPTDDVLTLLGSVPGVVLDVDPEDAERAGAFEEDALSPEDAADARFDTRLEA